MSHLSQTNKLFWPQFRGSALTTGTFFSFLVHAGLFLVLYVLFMGNRSVVITNLEMDQVVTQPPFKWTLPKKGHHAAEKIIPEKVQPEPVESKTVWVPESQTTRKPRWVGNLMDPDDYPSVARQSGSDGQVVLLLHIDTQGLVQEVRLLKGSYEVLNEFAIRKVKAGIFTPACDINGAPVDCEVTLPILFQLN
jgi:TonB family protein